MGSNSIPLTRTIELSQFSQLGLKRATVKGNDGEKIDNVFTDANGNMYKVTQNDAGKLTLTKLTKERSGNLFHTARYSTREADAEAQKAKLAAREGDITSLLENHKDQIIEQKEIPNSTLIEVKLKDGTTFTYDKNTKLMNSKTYTDPEKGLVLENFEPITDTEGNVTGTRISDDSFTQDKAHHFRKYENGKLAQDHVTGTINNLEVDYKVDANGRIINDKMVTEASKDIRVPNELKKVLGDDFNYKDISEINYQYYDDSKVSLAEIKFVNGTSRKIQFNPTNAGNGVKTDTKFDENGQEIKEPEIYNVVKGDNLTKIAKEHNTTLKELLELNPELKNNPNLIKVGQQIKLPNGNTVTPEAPAATPNVPDEINPPAVTNDAIPKNVGALGEIPDLANIDKYDPNNGNTITINGQEFEVKEVSSDNLGKTVFLANGNQINIAYNDNGSIKGINLFNNSNWPNHVVMQYDAKGKPLGSIQRLYDGDDNNERKMCTGEVIRNAQGEVTGFTRRSGTENEWTVDCFKSDGTFAGRILRKQNGDELTEVFYGTDGKKAETIPEEFKRF